VLNYAFIKPFVFQERSLNNMKNLAFRLTPGTDLKAFLDNYAAGNKIDAAIVLSCLGSLENACIRMAAAKEISVIKGPLEIITMTGNFSKHGSHFHIAVSDTDGKMTGGHLKEGSIIRTTAEIVIAILEDVSFERVDDPSTGYKELKIVPK
jgi:predicted DNA-binding protein with PD1-like motif